LVDYMHHKALKQSRGVESTAERDTKALFFIN
jgi:hypothetical protein